MKITNTYIQLLIILSRKTIKIIYRLDEETKTNLIDSFPNLADSEPKKGDIVRLVGTRNRNTYRYKSRVGDRTVRNGVLIYVNDQGFRNQTKAVVVGTHEHPTKTNFHVN